MEKRNDNKDKTAAEGRNTTGGAVHDFWASSTLHGLPRVFKSQSAFWKVFWLLVFLLMIALCIYQMVNISEKFHERQTTTSVTVDNAGAEFPSVMICNNNKYRESSYLNRTTTEGRQNYVDAKAASMDPPRLEFDPPLTADDWPQMGHLGEDMVVVSMYSTALTDSAFTADELIYTWSTSHLYGNCYEMNVPEAGDLQRHTGPLKAARAGPRDKVMLYLNAQEHQYLYGHTFATGLALNLYPYHTTSSLHDARLLSIPTGHQVDISLTQITRTRLEAPYGECDQDHMQRFQEMYGLQYTVQACKTACEYSRIADKCHCYNPDPVKRKYYTKHQLDTLQPCSQEETSEGAESCEEQLEREMSEERMSKNNSRTDHCKCTASCYDTTYDTVVTSSPLNVNTIWPRFKRELCRSETSTECSTITNVSPADRSEYVRHNYAIVYIYFQEPMRVAYTEQPIYTASQVIADFGGSVSLFLGASIITILELLELLIKLTAAPANNKDASQEHHEDTSEVAPHTLNNSNETTA